MTLQANFGSHARVVRVFAFDPTTEQVSVLWKNRFDGSESIETVPLSDLEGIAKNGSYLCSGHLRAEVKRRASYVLNPNYERAA